MVGFSYLSHSYSTNPHPEDNALPPEVVRALRSVAFSLKYSLCREGQEELGDWPELDLPSVYRREKLLEELSGLKEVVYHCCINTCVLFTGEYEDYNECPICKEPRRDNRKRPRNVFRYLPLIPRLQLLFRSPKMIEKLHYRQKS